MLNPDVRARLAAIVMLLLSLSILVLYISVEAGARPVKAIAPVSVQANSADTIPSSRA